MYQWISSNSRQLNLLLVQRHLAENSNSKASQGRKNVTRVRVEPRPCNQGFCKNDTFTLLATFVRHRLKQTGTIDTIAFNAHLILPTLRDRKRTSNVKLRESQQTC